MKTKKLFTPILSLLLIVSAIIMGNPVLATAALFMPNAQSYALGLSSIDVSALTGYAQAMQKPLISTLVNAMDIKDDILFQPGVKNTMALPKLKVGKGFKPYTGSFVSEDNAVKYTDRLLTVKVGQRDLLIDPEDYRTKYLAWQAGLGAAANNKENQIPFAQYLWNQIIVELASEINDQTAFFGYDYTGVAAYGAGTVYNPGDRMYYTQNGVVKYFENLVTTTAGQNPDTNPTKWNDVSAGGVSPGIKSYLSAVTGANAVATGAITDGTTGLAKATQLYQAVGGQFRKTKMVLHCSFTDFDFILNGVLNTYNKYTEKDVDGGFFFLPLSNKQCVIKPATWMAGSRRMILEPCDASMRGQNLIMGVDLLSDLNQIEVIKRAYKLELAIKFALGFQISDVNAIWINDQV